MGSSSVGGGKSKAGGEMPKAMQNIITQFWNETSTLRSEIQTQLLEAAQTGGAQAQIPIVQKAEAAQRRQNALALRDIEMQLGKTGLAGTPFGENIRAQQEMSGRTALAGIGPEMAGQFISQIPGYVMGAAQSIMGSLAGTRQTKAEAKSYM